ncbi:MAG TPA: GNAT family N-acetyltransferase [Terriglobales bacterium]|nr:GNAT family N-acetyltransferase [Terriglobales bacterium]
MNAPALAAAITIRETRPEDLEEILAHRRLMFHDMGHCDEAVLEAVVGSSRSPMQKYLADGSYRGWFAIAQDGRVAAGAGLMIMPLVSGPLSPDQINRPYLLNVYTYPEFRNRGLARMLTNKAIDWCRTHGFKVLWLHASHLGRPLYESLGFEASNEMKLIIK